MGYHSSNSTNAANAANAAEIACYDEETAQSLLSELPQAGVSATAGRF